MKLIGCHINEHVASHEADILLRVTIVPGECSAIKEELMSAIREQSDLLIQQTTLRSGQTPDGYHWQEVPQTAERHVESHDIYAQDGTKIGEHHRVVTLNFCITFAGVAKHGQNPFYKDK